MAVSINPPYKINIVLRPMEDIIGVVAYGWLAQNLSSHKALAEI